MFSRFVTRQLVQSGRRFSSVAPSGGDSKTFPLLAVGVSVAAIYVYGTILEGTKTSASAGLISGYHVRA